MLHVRFCLTDPEAVTRLNNKQLEKRHHNYCLVQEFVVLSRVVCVSGRRATLRLGLLRRLRWKKHVRIILPSLVQSDVQVVLCASGAACVYF